MLASIPLLISKKTTPTIFMEWGMEKISLAYTKESHLNSLLPQSQIKSRTSCFHAQIQLKYIAFRCGL